MGEVGVSTGVNVCMCVLCAVLFVRWPSFWVFCAFVCACVCLLGSVVGVGLLALVVSVCFFWFPGAVGVVQLCVLGGWWVFMCVVL